MSTWLDLVKTDFVISTGDDKVYTPYWLNARKAKEFLTAKFNFRGIDGTLVKKGSPMGRVYDIEIIFQGEDHLDVAKQFDDSSDDPRPWTITHPLYGSLYVQCESLYFDNTRMNVSRITGTITETILESGLAPSLSQTDAVAAQAVQTTTALADTYEAYVSFPKTSDITAITNHINGFYKSVSAKIANVQADVTRYENAFNSATGILNPAVYDSLQIIGQVQQLILTPAVFADTVLRRIGMMQAALVICDNDINAILHTYDAFINTRNLKKLYENNAGTCVTGICLAAITGITNDYDYRPDVLTVIDLITGAWNGYVDNLMRLQSLTGSDLDSYIPDATALIALQTLVYNTVQALFQISAGALQQRVFVLPYDDNLVTVAYLLYGSDPDDSKTLQLKANNNIGIDELLVLNAGRKIVYYV